MVVLYGADVHKVGLHMTVGWQQTGVPLLRAVHAPLRVEHDLKGGKNPRNLVHKCAKILMEKSCQNPQVILFQKPTKQMNLMCA
jgi:hypothetical protein